MSQFSPQQITFAAHVPGPAGHARAGFGRVLPLSPHGKRMTRSGA